MFLTIDGAIPFAPGPVLHETVMCRCQTAVVDLLPESICEPCVDGTQNGQDRNDQEGFRFVEVIMEGIPQVRKVSQKEDEVAGAINSLLVFFIEFPHTVKHAIHSLKNNNTKISCRGTKVINDYYFY